MILRSIFAGLPEVAIRERKLRLEARKVAYKVSNDFALYTLLVTETGTGVKAFSPAARLAHAETRCAEYSSWLLTL